MTRYFSEDHEWLDVDGEVATVGITEHAAEQLGELVFVELKEAGESFDPGDDMAVVESVKAASDVYAPLKCEILEANSAIVEGPALVNEHPESQGWFYKIKILDKGELESLMDEAAYKLHIA